LNAALGREGAVNITKLNLSKNEKLSQKTGIFLGDALIRNPDHPIEKISFKKVCLGEDGLLRILEAANVNHNIKKLNLGPVTDKGLYIMAKTLSNNRCLEKLKFEEHPEFPWCQSNKDDFVSMLKSH
jgi:hypothetical protein